MRLQPQARHPPLRDARHCPPARLLPHLGPGVPQRLRRPRGVRPRRRRAARRAPVQRRMRAHTGALVPDPTRPDQERVRSSRAGRLVTSRTLAVSGLTGPQVTEGLRQPLRLGRAPALHLTRGLGRRPTCDERRQLCRCHRCRNQNGRPVLDPVQVRRHRRTTGVPRLAQPAPVGETSPVKHAPIEHPLRYLQVRVSNLPLARLRHLHPAGRADHLSRHALTSAPVHRTRPHTPWARWRVPALRLAFLHVAGGMDSAPRARTGLEDPTRPGRQRQAFRRGADRERP